MLLKVTLDNSTFPEFVITADPVLLLNVTDETTKLPALLPIFCTVIAFSNPEYSFKSVTVNVYELVFIPLALVVLVNILLFPSISKFAFNVSYIFPSSTIHVVK